MAIHIGKKIREELDRQKMPVISFAKKINRSRNVVYDIFERESIDTALLHKIGKVLNCDFFSLYSTLKEYHAPDVKTFQLHESVSAYGKHSEEMKILQKENETLQHEVSYLKKIVKLMEAGKKKKKSSGK